MVNMHQFYPYVFATFADSVVRQFMLSLQRIAFITSAARCMVMGKSDDVRLASSLKY